MFETTNQYLIKKHCEVVLQASIRSRKKPRSRLPPPRCRSVSPQWRCRRWPSASRGKRPKKHGEAVECHQVTCGKHGCFRRKPLHQNTTCINMCSEKKTSVNCELEELGVCASKTWGCEQTWKKQSTNRDSGPIRMGPQTSTNNFLTYWSTRGE